MIEADSHKCTHTVVTSTMSGVTKPRNGGDNHREASGVDHLSCALGGELCGGRLAALDPAAEAGSARCRTSVCGAYWLMSVPTGRRPTGSALGWSPHDVRYPSPITPGAAGVHVDRRPSWWTWSTGCQRRARCTVRCSVAEYESRKPSAPLRTGHLCCCGGFRSASRHLAARWAKV